jgi:predicted secreted protein
MYNVVDVVTVDGRCTWKRLLAGSRRQRLSVSGIVSCGKLSTSATPTYFPSVLHSYGKKQRVFRGECRSVTIFHLVAALSLDLDGDCSTT